MTTLLKGSSFALIMVPIAIWSVSLLIPKPAIPLLCVKDGNGELSLIYQESDLLPTYDGPCQIWCPSDGLTVIVERPNGNQIFVWGETVRLQSGRYAIGFVKENNWRKDESEPPKDNWLLSVGYW